MIQRIEEQKKIKAIKSCTRAQKRAYENDCIVKNYRPAHRIKDSQDFNLILNKKYDKADDLVKALNTKINTMKTGLIIMNYSFWSTGNSRLSNNIKAGIAEGLVEAKNGQTNNIDINGDDNVDLSDGERDAKRHVTSDNLNNYTNAYLLRKGR